MPQLQILSEKEMKNIHGGWKQWKCSCGNSEWMMSGDADDVADVAEIYCESESWVCG